MAQAQEAGVDTPELANRLTRRKNELMSRPGDMRPARAVSLMQPMHHLGQGRMGRGAMDYPERDERGRFMSDDERGYGSRRGYYADEDEERGRGWSGEQRRGSRYEDDEERGARRSRHEDEDYGRGHPGWYGDPRGHSEAARRGWEERRSYEDEDDRRRWQHRR